MTAEADMLPSAFRSRRDELEEHLALALEARRPAASLDPGNEFAAHLQQLADRRSLVEASAADLRRVARVISALVAHALVLELTAAELLEISDHIEDVVACCDRAMAGIDLIASAK